MKNIFLFCAQGMSTSLLVNKMEKAANDADDDNFNIEAHNLTSLSEKVDDADIILLGPQVRFYEKKIKKEYPDKKVMVIDMKKYGRMDGIGVLEDVKKTLAE